MINENTEIFNQKTNKILKDSIKNGYKTVKLTIKWCKKKIFQFIDYNDFDFFA